jgi:hypothetical protein
MFAGAALAVAAGLAGCGKTTYFGGRVLPPSGLSYRVLIAIQNPNAASQGAAEIVDAYYDIRAGYTGQPASYPLNGYGGKLPISIQNMPEEQLGAIYGAGDGSLTIADYQKETVSGSIAALNGLSSSIFITRNQNYVFAASESAHVMTVVDQTKSTSYPLSLPGIYRVSVSPAGTAVLAFVQNSNYAYYPRQLTSAQTLAFSGGPSSWPKAAVDCEPQAAPVWCMFQVQSPDAVDATGNYYGTPLVFDRPIKAVFSADGSTAYVLNCGPECGGNNASISVLPVAPLIFPLGQESGLLPCNSAPCTNVHAAQIVNIPIPGGASNALVTQSTMYVVGQHLMPDGYFGGFLTVVNLSNNTVVPSTGSSPNPVSISDGTPGGVSRMLQADDNTLWIGMTKCNQGERYYNNQPYGCLTMYNTSTNQVVLLEPYAGDATGIAAITSLHKIYSAQGGQVYIESTVDGSAIDNQYVTVTGTASDVAYMDAITDANNAVY